MNQPNQDEIIKITQSEYPKTQIFLNIPETEELTGMISQWFKRSFFSQSIYDILKAIPMDESRMREKNDIMNRFSESFDQYCQ